ncbi:MAG: ribosome biogenesis GTPase YlqF [Oscillospiraceae bacterium]|jgi:ribosome biogenesis GTPase A|nr:ribosome biogenesis GTPase YlqF [Oscillospiraceae bacterium]
MRVQWFPGHMAKTRRLIAEHCRLVDAVCEVADARIPLASRNPELPALSGGKPSLLVLNRADQADAAACARWAEHYRAHGLLSVETDCRSGAGVDRFLPAVRTLLREKIEAYRARGQVGRPLRLMIVGIPNVGKSSLINRLAGRRAAAAEDRPGVTRGKQWYRLAQGLELLDTPGVLWPKFEDERTGLLLAYTGAIRDDILDVETLAAHLMALLGRRYPEALAARYQLVPGPEPDGFALLEAAARRRGFLLSGGVPDTERMARTLLDEYRGGRLGRFTLEEPEAAP